MSECAELEVDGRHLESQNRDLSMQDKCDPAVNDVSFAIGCDKLPTVSTINGEVNNDRNMFSVIKPDESKTLDLTDFDPLKPDITLNIQEISASLPGGELYCHSLPVDDFEIPNSKPMPVYSIQESPIVKPQLPTQPPRSPFKQGLSNLVSSIANRGRSKTAESISEIDLGGSQDYIYQAANLISLAQECEANGNYEVAFGYYKNGVGILLKGVQEDRHKSRREAVRKKTAQYLLKAEDLYNRHIANKQQDSKRWARNSKISPSAELDPQISYLQGPVSELRNYKVLGVIDKVMLIMDTVSQLTFVIKVLHKNSEDAKTHRQTIIPTQCPYMVQFYKFYETESSILILLQHAGGGKLWHYVEGYMQKHKESEVNCVLYNSHERKLRQGAITSSRGQGHDTQEGEGHTGVQGHCEMSDDLIAEPYECNSYVDLCNTYISTTNEPACNNTQEQSSKFGHVEKGKLHKRDSLGFDDYSSHLDTTSEDVFKVELPDQRSNDQFDVVLAQSKPSMEHFTIDSVDSDEFSEALCRQASLLSENINTIAEESPSNTARNPTESTSDELILNARELIESVDKVLAESDREVEGITGQKLTDFSRRKSSTPITLTEDMLGNNEAIQGKQVTETLSDDQGLVTKNEKCYENVGDDQCIKKERKSGELTLDLSGTISQEGDHVYVRSYSSPHTPGSGDPERQSMKEAKYSTRATSVERSLETPNSGRKRALTSVSLMFQELDLAAADKIHNERLPESCVKTWAAELLLAISHLHSLGIILRDLHPDNILLGERGHIQLTYFSQWPNICPLLNPDSVNGLYTSPEMQSLNSPSTNSCDWWSFGAILYELLTGLTLKFNHPSGITAHTEVAVPDFISNEAQSLLKELLQYHPNERIGSGVNGAEEIKSHPFFAGIEWKSLQKSAVHQ